MAQNVTDEYKQVLGGISTQFIDHTSFSFMFIPEDIQLLY